jgi:hypothetical protein
MTIIPDLTERATSLSGSDKAALLRFRRREFFGRQIRFCILLCTFLIGAIVPNTGVARDLDISVTCDIAANMIDKFTEPCEVADVEYIRIVDLPDQILGGFTSLGFQQFVAEKFALSSKFCLFRCQDCTDTDNVGARHFFQCIGVNKNPPAKWDRCAAQFKKGCFGRRKSAVLPFHYGSPSLFVILDEGAVPNALFINEGALRFYQSIARGIGGIDGCCGSSLNRVIGIVQDGSLNENSYRREDYKSQRPLLKRTAALILCCFLLTIGGLLISIGMNKSGEPGYGWLLAFASWPVMFVAV